MRQITKTSLALLLTSLIFFSCSGKLKQVSDDKFIRIWEIKEAPLMDGTQIHIKRENNKLVGRIYKLNDNKYVKLFSDSDDVWIPEISRISNFEFKLTENKIGKELFALYGQKTTQEFKVQFADDNTIQLSTNDSDPTKSTRIYKRVITAH